VSCPGNPRSRRDETPLPDERHDDRSELNGRKGAPTPRLACDSQASNSKHPRRGRRHGTHAMARTANVTRVFRLLESLIIIGVVLVRPVGQVNIAQQESRSQASAFSRVPPASAGREPVQCHSRDPSRHLSHVRRSKSRTSCFVAAGPPRAPGKRGYATGDSCRWESHVRRSRPCENRSVGWICGFGRRSFGTLRRCVFVDLVAASPARNGSRPYRSAERTSEASACLTCDKLTTTHNRVPE